MLRAIVLATSVLSVAIACLGMPSSCPGNPTAGAGANPGEPGSGGPEADERPLDFKRDIRPLFSDRCFKCHGPDGGSRRGKLRLDTYQGAFTDRASDPVIVPGNAIGSELYRRISASDPNDRMPPADSGRKDLSSAEVTLIQRWIDEGAPWEDHWSFVPPGRPDPPTVSHHAWSNHPVDRFILERLQALNLFPEEEADRETLIRRVTLDLTGLPPTLEDLNAFLSDRSPDAYEELVEKLLDRPQYGEHMARYWLDAVRYGDTHGLHLDNERSVWPYRDWVIRAFNDGKPFDEFAIEQLAGDLLPEPTRDQRIATGYVRSNVTTNEGGTIVEEAYVRNVVDRVETTSTVWLGLTAGCAACHDHKFDPISQKEFYQLFAYFNSGTDNPMDGNRRDHAPVLRVPDEVQNRELARLEQDLQERVKRFDAPDEAMDAAQIAWQDEWHERLRSQWEILEPSEYTSKGGATFTPQADRSLLLSGTNPGVDEYRVVARTDLREIVAIKLETLSDPSLPKGGTSRASHGNFVLNEFLLEAVSVANPKRTESLRFVAADADYSQAKYPIQYAIDGQDGTGWAMDGRLEDHYALFYASVPFGFEGGTELRFKLKQLFGGQHNLGRIRFSVTTDPTTAPAALGLWQTMGPFKAATGKESFTRDFGVEAAFQAGLEWKTRPEFNDGRVHTLPGGISATYLRRDIYAPSARALTLSLGSDDGIRVWLGDQEILSKDVPRPVAADQDTAVLDLKQGTNRLLMKINDIGGGHGFYFRRQNEDLGGISVQLASVLSLEPSQRSAEDRKRLQDHYRVEHFPEWRELQGEIARLKKDHAAVESQLPVTLVFEEMAKPKPAYLLLRGQYDQKGEEVPRALPAILPPLPAGAPNDRLGFARWLVDPSHPLTARVMVNRFWQQYFGTGLVKTAGDFGSQGEWPSHPELLDWLATEFIRSGWDVKSMQKLLVTSQAYRQSCRTTPDKLARDPANRWISRGPRFRMDAEMLRDQALAVSGLLVDRIGGKGVKPYQPLGLWKAVGYTSSNTANFRQDSGDALYRRSIYTFWKRTSPPPSMALFDAPMREACCVRRSRTNTPTAALTLMNDVQFVEAARHFATHILQEGGATDRERIEFAFRCATGRRPDSQECEILEGTLQDQRDEYRRHPEAARALITVGDSEVGPEVDEVELASWTLLSNLLLNLDETVTKG